MHYEFMGFTNNTANGVYEFNEVMSDTKAPLEHTADHNATFATAQQPNIWIKSGGTIMPSAGTVKRISGWAVTNGNSAEHKLALGMIRFAENDSTNVTPISVNETTWTSLGNNKLKRIDETSISNANLNAGDMLMTFIKDDTGGRQIHFSITVEIEF